MASIDPSVAVADLLGALRGTSIREIEVEWDDNRVRVAREPHGVVGRTFEAPPSEDPHPAVVTVASPYVGMFHRADLAVGDVVSEGQVLAEIETLTIRNPVTAPAAGVLTVIHLDDSTPVEYGQPLFEIERTAEAS